jgi:hypothetical protein|uniref:Apple domain-containing protein n=1 Tax=viral metagenome TaxID=1070528 RepID=A0A6C0IQB7_9ZZZZ
MSDNLNTNKQTFESEIDKFKSISEHYDTTSDPTYVTFNNIDLSMFTSSETVSDTDCKAACSLDDSCVAYAFVNGSCNKYTSINNNDFELGSDSLNLKLVEFGNYLKHTNEVIKEHATSVKIELGNSDATTADYYYDENNGDKDNLDLNYNALQETQKEYRNLIASNETKMDPIFVNTHYFRYMFLLTLMFIMLTTFIYFTVNNTANTGSNFMLYLVLFIIVFSVSIIYILK